MQIYYSGDHAVMFENPSYNPASTGGESSIPYFNSWEKWHLIPTSRPIIQPPPLKTNTIEVPGANSVIDLTEVPRGFPTFGNRTGSLEFYVDNSDPTYDWTSVYNQIKWFFHGMKLKMYLLDDTTSYYYGRWTVNQWKTNKEISAITLDYDLDPFMYSMFSTCEPWLWNPFDFQHGTIPFANQEDFANITIPSGGIVLTYAYEVVGAMPVVPTFEVLSGGPVDIQIFNSCNSKWTESRTVSYGEPLNDPSLYLSTPRPGDTVQVHVGFGSGITSATINIDFRPGRL